MIKVEKKPAAGATASEPERHFASEKYVLNKIIANSSCLVNDLIFDRSQVLWRIDELKKQLEYFEWLIKSHGQA